MGRVKKILNISAHSRKGDPETARGSCPLRLERPAAFRYWSRLIYRAGITAAVLTVSDKYL